MFSKIPVQVVALLQSMNQSLSSSSCLVEAQPMSLNQNHAPHTLFLILGNANSGLRWAGSSQTGNHACSKRASPEQVGRRSDQVTDVSQRLSSQYKDASGPSSKANSTYSTSCHFCRIRGRLRQVSERAFVTKASTSDRWRPNRSNASHRRFRAGGEAVNPASNHSWSWKRATRYGRSLEPTEWA